MAGKITRTVVGAVLALSLLTGAVVVASSPAGAVSPKDSCQSARQRTLLSFYAAVWKGEQIKTEDARLAQINAMPNSANKRRLQAEIGGRRASLANQREVFIQQVHGGHRDIARLCRR